MSKVGNKGKYEGVHTYPESGATFTVTRVYKGDNKSYYIYECSLCMQDPELWEAHDKRITNTQLQSNITPCWCCGVKRYNPKQYKILIDRFCKEQKYLPISKYDNITKVKDTVSLFDTLKKVEVNLKVENILSSVKRAYREPNSRLLKDHNLSNHVDQILSLGKLPEGTIFCRDIDTLSSKGYFEKLIYKCSVCSKDEYVEAGLCSGVFSSGISTLKDGVVSCRCSDQFIWNQPQREYQIRKWCLGKYEFLGWTDGVYKNSHSKFDWICSEGHKTSSAVCDFKYGKRCGECSVGGFNKAMPASLYVTRWHGDQGYTHLKYGITNKESAEKRVKEQGYKTNLTYEILSIRYYAVGYEAFEKERDIKDHFGYKGYACSSIFPDGFTETVEDTPENYNKIMQFVYGNYRGDLDDKK